MRFERGLRSAGLKPYPTGYIALPTDDINPQSPQCRFGGTKDLGVWIVQEDLPAIIEIGVTLTPIWVENETAVARIDKSTTCSIYPSQRIFSKVRVDAIGKGNYQKVSGDEKITFVGNNFLNFQLDLPKPCLYQKEFLVQPIGKNIRWVPLETSEEIPVLWAYGAQQIGDDIHPLVFSLESVRQETCLRPSSLFSWRERGIFPPLTGKPEQSGSVFQDIYEEDQTRTLMESIAAGMSVIHLNVGVDETGKTLRIPYYSYYFMKNFIFYKKGA